ncbi:MAG: hypothetical protein ACQER4_04995 [Bacteroidota bacterium]
MKPLLENIPHSLRGYLDHFQKDPDEAIDRLRRHLGRRGPDAVGHYLLAWLCHHNGYREEAVRAAWKARIFSPGSPATERLHYYLSHPDGFNAWAPDPSAATTSRPAAAAPKRTWSRPIQDLDGLIDKLSSVESRAIRMDPDKGGEPDQDLSADSLEVDDIVTDTIAWIHESQGNHAQAIRIYEQLKENWPKKRDEYEEKIARLKKELSES